MPNDPVVRWKSWKHIWTRREICSRSTIPHLYLRSPVKPSETTVSYPLNFYFNYISRNYSGATPDIFDQIVLSMGQVHDSQLPFGFSWHLLFATNLTENLIHERDFIRTVCVIGCRFMFILLTTMFSDSHCIFQLIFPIRQSLFKFNSYIFIKWCFNEINFRNINKNSKLGFSIFLITCILFILQRFIFDRRHKCNSF